MRGYLDGCKLLLNLKSLFFLLLYTFFRCQFLNYEQKKGDGTNKSICVFFFFCNTAPQKKKTENTVLNTPN